VNQERIAELTLKVLDDDADEAELEELEQAVEQDADARQAHLELLEQEAALRGLRAELDLTASTQARVWEATGDRVTAGVMNAVHRAADEAADADAGLLRDDPTAGVIEDDPMNDSDDSDSDVAGAFDSLFGGGTDDPFAGAEIDATVPDMSLPQNLDLPKPPDAGAAATPQEAFPSSDAAQAPIADQFAATAEVPAPAAEALARVEDAMAANTGAPAAPDPVQPMWPARTSSGEFDAMAPPPENEAIWYVGIGDHQVGPMSQVEMGKRWDKGEVNAEALVWREGQGDWLSLRDVVALRFFLADKIDGGLARAEPEAAPAAPTAEEDLPAPPIGDSAGLPYEADPFAGVDDGAAMGEVSDSWRPNGMTEVYQAAAEAGAEDEAEVSDPYAESAESAEEPLIAEGQLHALASLAAKESDEVSKAASLPIASAEDADLEDGPALPPPGVDLSSFAQNGVGDFSDPFAPKILNPDSEIAHIAGQSSLVRPRPLYEDEERRPPWMLIGLGGGGVVAALLTVAIVLVVRDPTPETATESAATAEAEQLAAAARPAAEPADGVGAQPLPPTDDPAGAAVAAAKEPAEKKSGNCDPLLYTDGNCPEATGGSAAAVAEVKNELDKSDIINTVKEHSAEIEVCAAGQRKRSARLAEGTIKVQWYVRPDGRTKNVAVLTPKFKGTFVGDCVVKSVKQWRFPAFRGDEVGPIKFPFSLD